MRLFTILMMVHMLTFPIYGKHSKRIDCGVINNKEMRELSGIAASRTTPGVLWVHNDSGDKNRIFAISDSCKNLGVFYLNNYEAVDWEDIATGPGPADGVNYLYVGDIGDNHAKRKIKSVYRFREPNVTLNDNPKDNSIDSVETIRFRYPDGNRDAEALMVDPLTKDIFIISKREMNVKVYIASYPQDLGNINTLQCIDTLDIAMVVAADISPSGNGILMKNYHKVYYWNRLPGESVKKALSRSPVELPYVKEPQGEAISWDQSGTGYYTISEEDDGVPSHLYYYPDEVKK